MGKVRIQEGTIHIYFRSNGRQTVFYEDEDYEQLLKRCSKYARKNQTLILEFALMINHVHLLVYTRNLSKFMKEFLQSYSRWYNRKYKSSNKIFKTPFSSACKNSEEWEFLNRIYILQNPVKAGICKSILEYKWSSVHFHFPDGSPIYSFRQALSPFIQIEPSINIDKTFSTKKEFITFINTFNLQMQDIIKNQKNWERDSYSVLTKLLKKALNGKVLAELSRQELDNIILFLIRNSTGKLSEIASVTHENYDYVRKLSRRNY